MPSRTLQVTLSMMPEMWDQLEEQKPDDIEMGAYLRDILRKEIHGETVALTR